MSKANEKQIGGNHYKSSIQHWDYVVANDLDYFQAQITKYVTRWKKKAGMADLEKALHFLEKYMEIEKSKGAIPVFFSRDLPPIISRTEQSNPFGFEPEKEGIHYTSQLPK